MVSTSVLVARDSAPALRPPVSQLLDPGVATGAGGCRIAAFEVTPWMSQSLITLMVGVAITLSFLTLLLWYLAGGTDPGRCIAGFPLESEVARDRRPNRRNR